MTLGAAERWMDTLTSMVHPGSDSMDGQERMDVLLSKAHLALDTLYVLGKRVC